MTATDTYAIVKSDRTTWDTKAMRDLYGDQVVRLVNDRRDTNLASTWVFVEGPLKGQEIWLRDDQLDPWPRPIPTCGES